jgi:pimeloyl-ACP methyl ester carboxylesterase
MDDDTDRYEVFAPTMVGHNAGPEAGTLFLDTRTLAARVETQLDELGWGSAHIVGNSLGAWVAFELNGAAAPA